MNLDEMYRNAVGFEPYDYQRRVAEEGLPELLQVPTGCGKTEAVGLGWLYRRRFHPEPQVRANTPHWLAIALPMRTLVEQTYRRIENWLQELHMTGDVDLHQVQGGVNWTDRDWRLAPDRDAVFVGTIDMLLSRALNRGYADRRWNWPMSFGGFNNGTHWVFDEIQLMDVATPNTRQLQSFRDEIGTALPTSSTWMSATVDRHILHTVNRPDIGSTIKLSESDRLGTLHQRLESTRTFREIELPDKKPEQELARELLERHEPSSLTLAVFNTVQRAIDTYNSLKKAQPDADIVLLHSRYRPGDREKHTEAALSEPKPAGKIVVSTQVLEAGIDISAALMFTEAAPWTSIVQRAGRCNRDGKLDDAQLLWAKPPTSRFYAPYGEEEVNRSIEALRSLENQEVTTPQLQDQEVDPNERITPVIRKKDLIDLFDTTPDLSGNDLDVARFIRDSGDRTAQVAWRHLTEDGKPQGRAPRRDELCGVPIAELKVWLKGGRQAWRLDHLSRDLDNPWMKCRAEDLFDGVEVVLDADKGGYDSKIGWNRQSKQTSEVAPPTEQSTASFLPDGDVVIGDDSGSLASTWYPLAQHLVDVERECGALLVRFGSGNLDLTPEMKKATILAGRLHDIGKASSVWQEAALATANEEHRAALEAQGPFAKTGSKRALRLSPRFFRHELASALALMNEGASALGDCQETDLVIYLVASHHGRVRLSIRRPPEESGIGNATNTTLGVAPGDELPEVNLGNSSVPESSLTIPTGIRSYEGRALALRDRDDLGPFRLAFLEMVVRSADWQASRAIEVNK